MNHPQHFRFSFARAWLLFLAAAVIAYAGIAFLQYSLKWDMLDCYLPWRYFVGESISHGVFPLWNPYQHLGYPIHADLRSVFFVEGLLMGLLGGYTIYTLHYLFIFYISLAGAGMYLLSGHFTNNTFARLLAGFAYLLSGFFVSHGQEMFGIIAATFIPYIIYYFIRIQLYRQWEDVWKAAFFLFLQLTGGYQALSIMLFYLLALIFIAVAIQELLKKSGPTLKNILLLNSALAAITLASMTVLIVTYFQVAPMIGRFGGTTLADAQFMPFSPRSLISMVLPFASVKDTAWFDTDLSMNNAYVGLAMLAFYALSWTMKGKALLNIFRVFGLVCLFAAFGKYTPVREWLYDYVPLMNLFRMSAFFRYYAMLSFILAGAVWAAAYFENPRKNLRYLLFAIPVIMAVIVLLAVQAIPAIEMQQFSFGSFIFQLNDTLEFSSRQEHILAQTIMQIAFLLIFLAGILIFRKSAKTTALFVIAFTLLEMGVALRMNFPVTIGSNHSPSGMQRQLNALPQGFPLPDLNQQIAKNRDLKPGMEPLWRNTNIYTKTVSGDGFNSFRLDVFETTQRDYPEILQAVIQNPALFLSDQVKIPGKEPFDLSPRILWVDEPTYRDVYPAIQQLDSSDTIILRSFDPGLILAEVHNTNAVALTLMQTFYPGWEVFVNGQRAAHFISNTLFISCLLPAGKNTVEFRYSNPAVMAAFYFSYLIFAIIVAVIFFNELRKKKSKKMALRTVGLAILIVGIVFFILIKSTRTTAEKRAGAFEHITNTITELNLNPDSTLLVLNVDDPAGINALMPPGKYQIIYQRFSNKTDLPAFSDRLKALDSGQFRQFVFVTFNLPQMPEAEDIIRKRFPVKTSAQSRNGIYLTLFEKGKAREPLFATLNDFENSYPYWSGDLSKYDSTQSYSGRNSWRLDASRPGSPALVEEFGKLNATGHLRLAASAMAWLNEGADAAMYLSIERDGSNIWQQAVRVSEFTDQAGHWTSVMISASPGVDVLPADKLKFFFWIQGDQPLHIDDMELRIFPQNE